jgi:hypothetical protein
VYSGHANVPVNAKKMDVMRLAAEGYVDCELNSQGDPRGKPTAAGIALVKQRFSEFPALPIQPDSIKLLTATGMYSILTYKTNKHSSN